MITKLAARFSAFLLPLERASHVSLPFWQYRPPVAINATATLELTLSVNGGRDFRRPCRRSGNRGYWGARRRSPNPHTHIEEPPPNNSMQRVLPIVYNQS